MAIDIVNAAEYQEVISKINLWYGNDAQRVINIANQYELTPAQLTEDWLSGSGYEPWYTSSGAIGGYNSAGVSSINYASAAEQAINSNAGSTTQVALKTPIETTINSQTGVVQSSTGLTSAASGLKSGLTFVSQEVLPAVSAAGLGISLGKAIDSALYNANPDFWDNVGMSTLNPETWNTITKDYPDGALKKAFNTVFGLNPNTGETQQYLDENAAAYLAQYMYENGVFDPTIDVVTEYTKTGSGWTLENPNSYNYPVAFGGNTVALYWRGNPDGVWTATGSGTIYSFGWTNNNPIFVSDAPFTVNTGHAVAQSVIDGHTYYSTVPSGGGIWRTLSIPMNTLNGNMSSTDIIRLAFGGKMEQEGGKAGMPTQQNATTPDFTNCQSPADYKTALRNQFPDLYNNAVTQSVVNPDGTTQTITYIPIGTPTINNDNNKTQPITTTQNSGSTQTNQSANPTTLDLTGLENLIKTITDTLTPSGTPTNPENPDPTGSGDTPTIVTPTGQASALWSVYNPSQAQLNSFGAWLWSSNFIDQVLKLFNNPMQSIIGVHKIFATPATSGAGSITVGYLDSGVSANLVSNQYTDIDCGTVKVDEQFGNVFDYTDTHIRLYLPFIGIVDLDNSDVMRGAVKVIYHVDVITGACLADVIITRDGAGGVLYQFAGDAAVRYPISSGSYIGVMSGIASAIGGVASAVMTGGATLPLAAGAIAGGIGSAKTNVQHSGNFSGNAGAMGAKKPYLIIERPQTMIADNYNHYQGGGTNTVRTVAQMSGYFKFSDVHTDSISKAAESEIEAIRAALESGVIK